MQAAAVEVLGNENDLLLKPLAVVFVTNEGTDSDAEELSRLTAGRSAPVSIFVAPAGVLKDVAEGYYSIEHIGGSYESFEKKAPNPLNTFLSPRRKNIGFSRRAQIYLPRAPRRYSHFEVRRAR